MPENQTPSKYQQAVNLGVQVISDVSAANLKALEKDLGAEPCQRVRRELELLHLLYRDGDKRVMDIVYAELNAGRDLGGATASS